MVTLDGMLQRIAQYRVCLERDAERGIIPVPARARVDSCFATLGGVLEAARIELEGAGVPPGADAFARHLVGSCGDLARQMFARMYREPDAGALHGSAVELETEARRLVEHLWLRLQQAA